LPEKIYTTYQIGKFCQVNIRTVIRWIETGKLKAYSTPGGHRRVKWSDLINFLTQNRMPIPRELEEAKKRKVLVVDDDLDFLEIASKVIEKIPDAEVRTTASGFDAGVLVAEWNPDLILPVELEKVKTCGVDSVITKPIENESFLKKIDRFLYASRS